MEIKYLDQINAFAVKSAGVLNANEQVVYMRLLFIWNGLRRPEWFGVAASQLRRECGLGSDHTIIKARNGLVEKGFIAWMVPKTGIISKYKIIPLQSETTYAENAEVKRKTCAVGAEVKDNTYAENAEVGMQNLHRGSALSAEGVCNKCTGTSALGAHIKEKRDLRDYKENKREPSDDFEDVREVFENNIHIISGMIEMQKLQDDTEHYGAGKVIEAIEIAVGRGIHNLNYIEGILKKQEALGEEQAKKEEERKAAEEKKKRQDAYVYGSKPNDEATLEWARQQILKEWEQFGH